MPSRLLDARGRPVESSLLTQELAAGSNITGVRPVYRWPVSNTLTPERLAEILLTTDTGGGVANIDYLTLAEEMEERDLHYHSVLSTRKNAVGMLPVTVEASGEDDKSVMIADAVREMTEDDAFQTLTPRLMDALGKGYSVCEIMWDKSGAQWWPEEYKWRDQRWFRFDWDQQEELRLIDLQDLAFGIPLEPYKFIQHRPEIKTGLPIRGGLARLVCVMYMLKGFTIKDWMVFAEVYGMPLRIGKYQEGATPEQKAELLRAVANIGTDAAAIVPDTMLIEIIQAAAATNGHQLFSGMADFFDAQISKGVLGQTMSADSKSSGIGSGNADLHGEVRKDYKAADAKYLSATINRDLVIAFVDLNFGPQDKYPYVRIAEEEIEDLKTLSVALPPFINAGLKVKADQIREKFRLDKPEDGDEILQPSPKPAPPMANATPGVPPGGTDPKVPTLPGLPKTGAGDGRDNDSQSGKQTDSGVGEHQQDDTNPRMMAREKRQASFKLLRDVMGGATLTQDQRILLASMSQAGAWRAHTDAIDELSDQALTQWKGTIDPMLEPIFHLARNAGSFEEMKRALESLKLDSSKLAEVVAHLTFKARGMGDATDQL